MNSNTPDRRHTRGWYNRTQDYVGEKWWRGEGHVSDTRFSFFESQASVETFDMKAPTLASYLFLSHTFSVCVFFRTIFATCLLLSRKLSLNRNQNRQIHGVYYISSLDAKISRLTKTVSYTKLFLFYITYSYGDYYQCA